MTPTVAVEKRSQRAKRIAITLVALAIAAAHLVWPGLKIDEIALALLFAAAIPWLVPLSLFKSIELPGGLKLEIQGIQKASHDQTIATIVTWVQAEDIRQSRSFLYDLEETEQISRIPGVEWKEEWSKAGDQVCHSFNSAAIIAGLDPALQESWVRPMRRAIILSWHIVRPRIDERRKDQADLWEGFEWLANEARKLSGSDELEVWTTSQVKPKAP